MLVEVWNSEGINAAWNSIEMLHKCMKLTVITRLERNVF